MRKANNALALIQKKAKQIRREHPRMKYTDAIKKASASLRHAGKIGATKKKASVKKPISTKSKSLKTTLKKDHLRLPHGYEVEKRKRLAGMSERLLQSELKKQYELKLGKLEAKKHLAKTKTEKRKLQAEKTELLKKLRSL